MHRKVMMILLILAAIYISWIAQNYFSQENHPSSEKVMYMCPMHPSYVSDAPGDCPICNMRLVPMKSQQKPPSQQTTTTISDKQMYTCPMHPTYVSDAPGDCPICNMKLVPMKPVKSSPSLPGMTTVTISEQGRKLSGIQTVPAVSERIHHTIRTVGIVVPDETKVKHIHTKVSGWIEKLFVNFSGQMVHQGDPLFSIYSPELMTSQKQFLEARAALEKTDLGSQDKIEREELLKAVIKRLELFDVPPHFLAQLEKSRTVQRTVTLVSSASGFVTTKQIFEGQQVEPGMELFTITDISQVWIEAEFYEFESHLIKLDQEASLTSPYDPNIKLSGKIAYIYPSLNPVSRTLKARFKFDNPEFKLKLGMYMDVSLMIESMENIVVPDSAIMDSGIRKIVFVDKGNGQFEPKPVQVGIRSNGKAQILSGIQNGENIVIKGNFLLDSESRLRSAISETKSNQ